MNVISTLVADISFVVTMTIIDKSSLKMGLKRVHSVINIRWILIKSPVNVISTLVADISFVVTMTLIDKSSLKMGLKRVL